MHLKISIGHTNKIHAGQTVPSSKSETLEFVESFQGCRLCGSVAYLKGQFPKTCSLAKGAHTNALFLLTASSLIRSENNDVHTVRERYTNSHTDQRTVEHTDFCTWGMLDVSATDTLVTETLCAWCRLSVFKAPILFRLKWKDALDLGLDSGPAFHTMSFLLHNTF